MRDQRIMGTTCTSREGYVHKPSYSKLPKTMMILFTSILFLSAEVLAFGSKMLMDTNRISYRQQWNFQTNSSPGQKLDMSLRTQADANADTDTDDDDHNIKHDVPASRSLIPNQILHPLYFPFNRTNKEENKEALEPLSFPMAIQKIIETLESILSSSRDEEELGLKIGGGDLFSYLKKGSQGGSTVSGSGLNEFDKGGHGVTIQIEQQINHPIDTLCWLHANQPRIEALNPLPNQKPPMIYLSNAENTFEAASVGSALTINNLHDETYWKIIKSLPEGSGVYGGKRFDEDGDVSDEWKEFGKELWILPAVELRHTRLKEDSEEMSTSTSTSPPSSSSSSSSSSDMKNGDYEMSLIVHLHFNSFETLIKETSERLDLMKKLTADVSTSVPCTTLPPISYRGCNPDAQDVFEKGINAALQKFKDEEEDLEKVVLARRSDLKFNTELNGLDVMKKLRFGGSVGHFFYMDPGKGAGKEFLGCTPERLFQVRGDDGSVISEALAGTRPRGSTPEADAELMRDLMHSDKDREENIITGKFIRNAFESLQRMDMINIKNEPGETDADGEGIFFVRRLRHVQHICQSVEGEMKKSTSVVDVVRYLLDNLHPTPAVCGFPGTKSLEFIRQHESISFDRGFYAGPFGFLGSNSADIVVAIRSALLVKNLESEVTNNIPPSSLSIYAGAGIVPGSAVQDEWSETGYKLGALSSTFTQTPLTLKSFLTPNEAWAIAFVEELIRSGVTQFYVCPGSRSTPLTAALARAMRSHIGIIDCISVHDERGAAFRALGYARATKRPAAIVTSSGTAVANLYPAVIEASMDGVPLLLLTADRPYENRDTGANQAIDQVKIFSESYVRWFRDISPPSEDVPVSLALSDANHAVSVANDLLGPVHLNIQFRENLAPDPGPIRGDKREGSITSFSSTRFTDIAGFQRWSLNGHKWSRSYSATGQSNDLAVYEVADAIARSKRGIIVVGNLRSGGVEGGSSDAPSVAASISDFAESIGFPIFAGAQSSNLRFYSPAVIPYAEHLLKNNMLKSELQPDLIIQIGSHLISTEVQGLIDECMKNSPQIEHVLLHTSRPAERVDAGGTMTLQVFSKVEQFLPSLQSHLQSRMSSLSIGSSLSPLILIGKSVADKIPEIIQTASKIVTEETSRVWESSVKDSLISLTEPQIILGMSEVLSEYNKGPAPKLFLSNSMPVRDAEFFLYPTNDEQPAAGTGTKQHIRLSSVAVNRGASGIDGIISSATGFAEATSAPTTLLIGDLATLHDVNAFHSLSPKSNIPGKSTKAPLPLTSVIVNNNGGGIFSFLPIAKHGNDVNFEEFFGTPTNSFSFVKGAEAFGLPVEFASDYDAFKNQYRESLSSAGPSVLEARVVDRSQNVQVHMEITKLTNELIEQIISPQATGLLLEDRLPARVYKGKNRSDKEEKTLVLLHGWMGDKNEWDEAANHLTRDLPNEWNIISIDLPGHGDSRLLFSDDDQIMQTLSGQPDHEITIDDIAESVMKSLNNDHGVETIKAIAGYSLGGRVALAMKKISCQEQHPMILDDTELILLGASPGALNPENLSVQAEINSKRRKSDNLIATDLLKTFHRLHPSSDSTTGRSNRLWANFLSKWYGADHLWADLQKRDPQSYSDMIRKRVSSLLHRAPDIANMLNICSPGMGDGLYWSFVNPQHTVFVAGQLDQKYTAVGREWRDKSPGLTYYEVQGCGHSLLTENSRSVANVITGTLTDIKDMDRQGIIGHEAISFSETISEETKSSQVSDKNTRTIPSTMDMEEFCIDVKDGSAGKGASGIGWGDQGKTTNTLNSRRGLIISVSSHDGYHVGIGEISPLKGVHSETFEQVQEQIHQIQNIMNRDNPLADAIECERLLAMNGSLNKYINKFINDLRICPGGEAIGTELYSSVRSGLEMALLSLASHAIRIPLPKALQMRDFSKPNKNPVLLPLNGLVTRKEEVSNKGFTEMTSNTISYTSTKVKVGHGLIEDDAVVLIDAGNDLGNLVRADANRAWSKSDAITFFQTLSTIEPSIADILEFIEEPIEKVHADGRKWSLNDQIEILEEWYESTGIKYALDESLADAIFASDEDFDHTMRNIQETMRSTRGCAAFVLKPSLLGIERSESLSRMAREELGIGSVFTSTFDSGVGLAFISFLASLSDAQVTNDEYRFAHGLSTFTMFHGDTLTPTFGSYVNSDGLLNVASLGRAIHGLGLDEIRDYIDNIDEVELLEHQATYNSAEQFSASSSTSDEGRDITIHVSLPLPFSDDIASNRFTDLPQQSRWSPWINSVSYLEKGLTEWTMNVRGVEFRWEAQSKMLDNPKGIMWESTSGLKNKGHVEFIKVSDNSCLMRVRMSIITPRIIAFAFKSSGEFVKDFVERKLLKWSLESFRDVVKADLALERGDAELGDALFDAVEGRSNAIEATLSYPGLDDKK